MNGPYSNFDNPMWSAWAEQQPERGGYCGFETPAELRADIAFLCDGDKCARFEHDEGFTDRAFTTLDEVLEWARELRRI